MRARCADGPYAGQTFEFPRPNIHWFLPHELRHPWERDEPVGPLMWIVHGVDRHCYTLATNDVHSSRFCGFRLVYRDTF